MYTLYEAIQNLQYALSKYHTHLANIINQILDLTAVFFYFIFYTRYIYPQNTAAELHAN